MKKVFRVRVPVDGLPHPFEVGRVVHVDSRDMDSVDVWFESLALTTDPKVRLQVFGTGHPIPDGATYLGTALTPATMISSRGQWVWHLYELPPEDSDA